MSKKSGPEHHHFTFFALLGGHHTHTLRVSACSAPPTAGSTRTQYCVSADPRVSGRLECKTKASWQFRIIAFFSTFDYRIWLIARSGAPYFHAPYTATIWFRIHKYKFMHRFIKLDPEPGPIFHFALALYLPQLWGEYFAVSTPRWLINQLNFFSFLFLHIVRLFYLKKVLDWRPCHD